MSLNRFRWFYKNF